VVSRSMEPRLAWTVTCLSFSTRLIRSVTPAHEELSPRWRCLFMNLLPYVDIASYTLTLVMIGQPLAILSASSILSAMIIE
jgi:hypothetical protein